MGLEADEVGEELCGCALAYFLQCAFYELWFTNLFLTIMEVILGMPNALNVLAAA